MRQLRLILPLLALPFATTAGAETLADIRVELGQLAGEFNKLRSELSASGAQASLGGGDMLRRMETLESELSRVTARAEEIELRLNRVVNDGTNRIGDIEFRLCEATEGCDPMNMPATTPLGGASAPAASAAPSTPKAPAASASNKPQLALSEQADFDRAKEVLGQGDFQRAATLFETYAQSFPGGPLIPQAHFLRGEALRQAGKTSDAGRAYVEAYSSDPTGETAPEALVKLGETLGQVGALQEACSALNQVSFDFPNAPAAASVPALKQRFNCQ